MVQRCRCAKCALGAGLSHQQAVSSSLKKGKKKLAKGKIFLYSYQLDAPAPKDGVL